MLLFEGGSRSPSLAPADRAAGHPVGCASRNGTRTIERDDPPARADPRRLFVGFRAEAPRGSLTHGRRLVQRLRCRRARRRHGRLHGRLPGGAARPQGGARRRGQDRWDMPPSRLHPDQGPARIGRLRRPGPPRQGLRRDAAGRAGHRLRGVRRSARRGREAHVDRTQDARDEEQGHLGRRPRPPRRPEQDPRQPAG